MIGIRKETVTRLMLPLVAAALPVVLLYSSLRTLRELDEQRAIYLRHRVSVLASRLENFDSSLDSRALWERLTQDEPYLTDLEIITGPREPAAQGLEALWNGRELFRMKLSRGAFRAYVPFHARGGLRIARIDLDTAAAEFLLVHARHNVIVSSIGGTVLVLLSVYSMWAGRRAAKLELRQLEMEHLAHIGKMSAVLAHEIRNPLGTIKGFIQLAAERGNSAIQSLLDRALSETQRLENLVKDLLSYGRPPSPQWRDVKWQDVAAVAQAHARHLIADRPIDLRVSVEPVAWRSDPELLEQALLNLIRNAVESIPASAGGEIQVDAVRDGADGVVIRVRDNGCGLPEIVRNRLFEPFLTTKASGTGLGLAVTRNLAASLGGTLEVKPAPVRGVDASLRFPRRQG